jgi:hypothetical protein
MIENGKETFVKSMSKENEKFQEGETGKRGTGKKKKRKT